MSDESAAATADQGSSESFWKRASKRTLAFIFGSVALLIVGAFLLFSYLDADNNVEAEPPPRATDKAPTPSETTQISIPIEMNSAGLSAAVERAIPKTLWTINQEQPRCIPPQSVKVFGKKVEVTPSIKCTIVGTVTRGRTRLRGEGRVIVVDVPIHAQIAARDVGGILKGETATGSAVVHGRITMDVNSQWQPVGKVDLSYNWTTPPGIDFLGQRITFTDKADEKLRPVLADVERTVQQEFRKIDLRKEAETVWRKAFTNLLVNEKNPPVWMRLTPQKIVFGGYDVRANRIKFNIGINGITETFVGDEPAKPKPTALPALAHGNTGNHLNFFIPVKADYKELEPVLLRALQKRGARPFEIPKVGNVMATFHEVTGYGAPENRIAVGLKITVKPQDFEGRQMHGMIWVTALPVNDPGSPEVRFENILVNGDTDKVGGDLLLQFADSPGVAQMLEDALTQNFTKDIADLEGKIRKAVNHRQEGDFLIQTSADAFEIGVIKAYGDGLYLPVRAKGNAKISYRP